jgi:primase-polymerase (primpol)-like protein
MYSTTTTTQSFQVEHFFNGGWKDLSSHADRSSAETALARWFDDDASRIHSTGVRIVHQTISIKTDAQVVKELEF